MDMPSTTLTSTSRAQTSKASDLDKVIRVAQAALFPSRAWICVGALIAFISFCHFSSLFISIQRHVRTPCRVRGKILLSRLPLAILDEFRCFTFRTTIPIGQWYTLSVGEVILTAAYIATIFSWSLMNSTNLEGIRYDPHYWANTAGNVASAQLSLLAALGSKNNIISLLTGISYCKLNFLHRMAARALCVLLWVHAAGRIKLGLDGKSSWIHPWVQCGLLSLIAMSILCLVSAHPLRKYNYAVFVIIHFVLTIIILATGVVHAKGVNGDRFVWPAVIIYGIDRIVHFLRILIFNNPSWLIKSRPSNCTLSSVEALSPSLLRITVPVPSYFHWRSGQCAYLSVPNLTLISHPFTICNVDAPASTIEEASSSDRQLKVKNHGPITNISSKTLTFLVQVKAGFTKRLLSASLKNEMIKVIVDGPYGTTPFLRGNKSAVLIAGGSGIAFTLPIFLELVSCEDIGATGCERVIFVWSLHDTFDMAWIIDMLHSLTQAPSELYIEVHIHITRPSDAPRISHDTPEAENSVEAKCEDAEKTEPVPQAFTIHHARPNIQLLVETALAQSDGPVSFSVCGGHSLANSLRSALSRSRFTDILKGGPTTSLHVESFEHA